MKVDKNIYAIQRLFSLISNDLSLIIFDCSEGRLLEIARFKILDGDDMPARMLPDCLTLLSYLRTKTTLRFFYIKRENDADDWRN